MIENAGGIIIFKCEQGEPIFLFLIKGDSWHDLPKGHIEKGEDALSAAIREAYEETGIKAKIDSKFTCSESYKMENGNVKSIIYFLYKSDPDVKVKLSGEHTGYEWIDYNSALDKVKHESKKGVIKSAYKFITDNKFC